MTEQPQLHEKIVQTIEQIKDGKLTPKNSGIGKMFHELMQVDENSYRQLVDEYKPIAAEYFKKHPNKVNKERLLQREMEAILAGLHVEAEYDPEQGPAEDREPKSKRGPDPKVKTVAVNKERVAKVRILSAPKVAKPKGDRDRKAFVFEGNEYGKGPLVLAILNMHVTNNPGIKHDDMKKAFPDTLLRSYGIFKKLDDAQEISKVRKRYFLKDEQLISLSDCKIAVCNQFTSDNILGFLDTAKRLGYSIA